MNSPGRHKAVYPLKQCSLYSSAALGVPVLFMSLGILSSEPMFNVLDWSIALLGIA